MKEGYLKVQLDYAPKENGPEFEKWCEKYGFDYLASGRRAWCSSLQTYFRGAAGVAFNDGDMILFYEEDVVDIVEAYPEVKRVQEKLLEDLEQADFSLGMFDLSNPVEKAKAMMVNDIHEFVKIKRKEIEK